MRYLLILLSAVILWSCAAPPSPQDSQSLYVNGVIWTGVGGAPDASVIAIDDGRIAYIGTDVPPRFQGQTQIDLKGQFLMPGFMDNHVHFMEGGAALASVDLRDAASPEAFAERIKHYVQSRPQGRWVLNGNWDHTLWGTELPHRRWIDKYTPHTPVYVIRIDGHMALANSAALAAASITKDTLAPEGGVIMRDANGELTGLLKGNALNLVLKVIPAPSDDELMEQFSLAQDHALSHGLTKIHAVTAYPTETTMLDTFQMAKARGIMKIRAAVSTPIESWPDMQQASQNGTGDAHLSWGGIKGFIDGSLGARTAWMYDPYTDNPKSTGLPLNDPERFKDWMKAADTAGLTLSIHALGDRGIDTVITAMTDIAGDDIRAKRYRIEHFQHPRSGAIKALAKAGIIASMQPYHAIDDGRWAADRLGPDRLHTSYAFRSILDAGGLLSFGSDWPVAPLSPIDGLYAAVTRRTLDGANPEGWVPEQKISVEQALHAYTAANAYAFGDEHNAGTLEVSKRADFTVLSADPRTVAPETLRGLTITRTVIAGQTVYSP